MIDLRNPPSAISRAAPVRADRRLAVRGIGATAIAMAAGSWTKAARSNLPWPQKPVRIMVQFGAGSASDLHARMVAEDLQSFFKQSFVVENKPGGSGTIAASYVAKSAPDGHTLLLTSNTANSINPFIFKKLPYDPIKDFTPIARLSYMPFVVLVSAGSPVTNMKELAAYGRANKIAYGYANATGQVAASTIAAQAGFEASAVPYKGTPAAMSDLIGGQFAFMIGDLGSAAGLIASNRVRPIAVITAKRSALAPSLPSVAESLPSSDFDLPTWLGVLGPAGLPASVVQALNARITSMLMRKEVAAKLASIGAEPAPASPAEFEAYMREQLDVWRVKVRDAGITPE
ncbi:MAG: tripartite tricarboxylate transporter substrate binding protein [Ottowia sp.]|uniref:Bug family tripartite tricarboxylate transporter substrate binding protein n=1 Tax=Ottowia sp. TaxID=1898956 RepID=UPI003C713303